MKNSLKRFSLMGLSIVCFVFMLGVAGVSAQELDIKPCYVCTNCALDESGDYMIDEEGQYILTEESEEDFPVWEQCMDLPSINLWSNGLIAVAILDPELNLEEFGSASASIRVDDLQIGAESVKWSVEDVNHDGTLDLVFHFSTNDLIPEGEFESMDPGTHELCLTPTINESPGEALCDDAMFFTKGQKSAKKK
ncbi:MAG: hypothetical protein ACOWYE_12070 [Desulfatiglandales bacterium]